MIITCQQTDDQLWFLQQLVWNAIAHSDGRFLFFLCLFFSFSNLMWHIYKVRCSLIENTFIFSLNKYKQTNILEF